MNFLIKLKLKISNLLTKNFLESYYRQLVIANGLELLNVPDNFKSVSICIAAVKQNGLALQYVKNQNEKICIAAIKNNWKSIQYVLNKTTTINLFAVKHDGRSLEYIENQSNEICLSAVKQYGQSIEYVKNQTPELCLAAIKRNCLSIYFIRDLSSIALLLDDAFIEKNASIEKKLSKRTEFQELKEIKNRLSMAENAINSIAGNLNIVREPRVRSRLTI